VQLNEFLILSAFLFCTGIYGVLARRNGVLVLMSVELMLAAVNVNLVAFSAYLHTVAGQTFALFVLTIAAAEVGVGLAMILLIYRNLSSSDLDDVDVLITSYALMRRDEDFLQKLGFHYVILDEAQHIKNPMSATARWPS